MDQLFKLGATLTTLRNLSGRSVSEAAAAAKLPAAELREAEAGKVSQHARERLAQLFGLDLGSLAEGIAEPANEQTTRASVFLLQGAYQDFDASDWGVLERALRSARMYSTQDKRGRQGLVHRLGLLPVPPAGPEPRDAAQQGHKLARRLRAQLQLGGEPLEDIRALLEDRLGIVVLVDTLSSINLRAASILDENRVGAAAVLSAEDEQRRQNPFLARVYLAHELCHLLFDPGVPGCVQIALDDHSQSKSKASLLESRAKGFAAEFLLPSQGLEKRLGQRSIPESKYHTAREMVANAAKFFKTPWEIATRHLQNLRFIDDAIVGEILYGPSYRPTRSATTTTLPAPGKPPLCLEKAPSAPTAFQSDSSTDDDLPAFVQDSRVEAKQQIQSFADEILKRAYDKIEKEEPEAATELLVEHIDALMLGNEIIRIRMVLERVDVNRTPPGVLTGILSLTSDAKQELGDTRNQFFVRAISALEKTWGVQADRLSRIARRLQ